MDNKDLLHLHLRNQRIALYAIIVFLVIVATSLVVVSNQINQSKIGLPDQAAPNTLITTQKRSFNKALLLDGSTACVETLNPTIKLHAAGPNGLHNFTIEGWFKTSVLDLDSVSPDYIVGREARFDYFPPFEVAIRQGKLNFAVNSSAGHDNLYYGRITGNTNLTLNTWYFFAAQREGDVLRLFLNGFEDAPSLTMTPFSGSALDGSLNIGCQRRTVPGRGWQLNYFTGLIDEIRISDIPRYASNFTPPSEPFDANLPNTLALWHFDEILTNQFGSQYIQDATQSQENNLTVWGSVQLVDSIMETTPTPGLISPTPTPSPFITPTNYPTPTKTTTPTPIPSPTPMVKNGGFELTNTAGYPLDWKTKNLVATDDKVVGGEYQTGLRSFRFLGLKSGAPTKVIEQVISTDKLTKGTTFTLSGWNKLNATLTSGIVRIVVIGTSTVNGKIIKTAYPLDFTTKIHTNWQKLESSFRLLYDTDRLVLRVKYSGIGGRTYFDNISFVSPAMIQLFSPARPADIDD